MTETIIFKSFLELGIYWHRKNGTPLPHFIRLGRRAVKSLASKSELARDMRNNRHPGYQHKHEL